MKSAKECECFPYKSKLVCYMEVFPDGRVIQLSSNDEKLKAFSRAWTDQSKIMAVWPGKYRSDLFAIDDLNAFVQVLSI
jgi:hypothetical protein